MVANECLKLWRKLKNMNLYNMLFGCRKASRCKRLLRDVRCRLKYLKNKRDSIIRHLHDDIVQLIMNRRQESTLCALRRIEQLTKDQSIMAAYDCLDNFCEFISINLTYILSNKDRPNDINVAASSLLYASARCGDLPELNKLRKLFGERYGDRFVRVAVELLPGNLVDYKVIDNLTVKSIPFDTQFRLLNEIARENGLELDAPETDRRLELQQNQVYNRSFAISGLDWDKKVIDIDIKPTQKSSAVQVHLNKMQVNTRFDNLLSDSAKPDISSNVEKQRKLDQITATFEGSFQLLDRNIVYLDDEEAFGPSIQDDSHYKDQIKPTYTPWEIEIGDNRVVVSDFDHRKPCETSVCKTSSRSINKRTRKSSTERLKRRYQNQSCHFPISLNSSMKDVEYAAYYSESWSRHYQRKNKKCSVYVGESRSSTSHTKPPSKEVIIHNQS